MASLVYKEAKKKGLGVSLSYGTDQRLYKDVNEQYTESRIPSRGRGGWGTEGESRKTQRAEINLNFAHTSWIAFSYDICYSSRKKETRMAQGGRIRILSDDEIEQIHLSALSILGRTGVEIREEQAFEVLKKAGCPAHGKTIRIPPPLVEEAIRIAPKAFILYGRDPASKCGWRVGGCITSQ